MNGDPPTTLRGFHGLLGTPTWCALLDTGFPRTYRRGDFLLRQGDPGGFVLALRTGRVKVVVRDQTGAELLASLRGPGDLVGELARNDTARTATVVAIDDCTASRLATDELHRFLRERAATTAFQDYLVAKLSETMPYQVQLVHFSSRQRIARLLLELVALADPGDPRRLVIPFSQESIAAALGIARSTVAEQLAALRQDGALSPGPRLTVSDLPCLTRHAGLSD